MSNLKDLTASMKQRMGQKEQRISFRNLPQTSLGSEMLDVATLRTLARASGDDWLKNLDFGDKPKDQNGPEASHVEGSSGPPPPGSDLELLKQSLKSAAALEFSTIPLYMVALWSVIDQNDPIAKSIRAILHEEMLHLSLVNNFLAAIGGTPRMTGADAPQYPGRLPSGVHPTLWVELAGLNDASIDVFLTIERPLVRVPVEGVEDEDTFIEDDQTIGEFYESLLQFARTIPLTFSTDRQIAGPLAPMVLTDMEDVENAIHMIQRQGEGSTGDPIDSATRDLAHYYRFLEMKLERKLVWIDKRLLRGERMRRPATYAVAPPPPSGYGPAAPEQIQRLSSEFNSCYSRVLRYLESAWAGGGHAEFLKAMEQMFNLRPIAQDMFRTPGPDGRGCAPEFRYVP